MNKAQIRVLPVVVLPSLMGLLGFAFCFGAWHSMESRAVARAPLQARSIADQSTGAFDALQNYWRQQFSVDGKFYDDARLISFREGVASPCGDRSAGSFYCPLDRSIYVDLGRYSLTDYRSSLRSNSLQAFVLAHEFGHHVQTLRGIAPKIASQRELQADCFAGLAWHGVSFSVFTETLIDDNAIERMKAFQRGLASTQLSECSYSG